MTFKRILIGTCKKCGDSGVPVRAVGNFGNVKCLCGNCKDE